MKSENVKNTTRNIVWGIVNRGVAFLVPFVMRTVLIYLLGTEYLGLDSLFTSILQMLNIAELGFSSAVVFSMYKPIATNDSKKICALLNLYRTAYRIIGLLILVAGLLFTPFLPRLIKGDIPADLNVYLLYFIFLGNAVVGYWMFAYKKSLLSAHQREDLNVNANTITTLLKTSLQLCFLAAFRDYYLFLLVMPVMSVAENFYIEWLTRKYFPQYVCRGRLDRDSRKDIFRRIGGLMIQRLCRQSRNSMDNIIISAYLGLTQVTIYGNYYTILYGIHTLLECITKAMTASVGRNIVVADAEKNHADMVCFTFMYMWIASVCAVCLLVIFQPFMLLWMGQELMLSRLSVILLCIYLYSLCMGDIRSVYVTSAGLWWEGRFRSALEAAANILLNIVLGKYLGISGIILATILSIVMINFIYGTTIIYRYYFKNKKLYSYYLQHVFYASVTVITALVVYLICNRLPDGNLIKLVIKGITAFFLSNICLLVFYHRTKRFRDAFCFVKNVVHDLKIFAL